MSAPVPPHPTSRPGRELPSARTPLGSGSGGSRAVQVLRAVFGLALFAALVLVTGPFALARVLRRASLAWLAAAAAAYAVVVLVKTERWTRVLRIQALALPRREALRAYGLGMLLGAGRSVSAAVAPWAP